MHRFTLAPLALMFAVQSTAVAQVCETSDLQTQLQYLRRLSLDLRGRLPSRDELESVVTNGALDPAIVDAMLASDDYIHQMRTHHLDLLWTNLLGLRITNAPWLLRAAGRGQRVIFNVANRGPLYRGGFVGCLDEPARFGSGGEILTTPDPQDPNIRREGWVEVAPYWAPQTTIRVCAFDAQEALQAANPRGNGVADCSRQLAPGCGCGPNLQWCQSINNNTIQAITGSMNEQLLRYVERIVREDRPYTDIVLGQDMELNGPLSHWLRLQVQTGGTTLPATTEQNHPVPEIAFSAADQWQSIERAERHAGVLTMPGYLLKFASDRGRANRFYNAFLCQHFESAEPIPPSTDPCHEQPDLTKRCGCKGCHLAVEPAAAHWGRWAEAGLLPLNEGAFPRSNPACAGANASRNPICRLFYFTEADVTNPEVDDAYVGQLRAYVYADSTREANIEAGPLGLAQQAVDSGAFARCTVERMWNLFLARAPAPEEAETVQQLADELTTDGYRLSGLVRALVTRPEYIEAGRFGEGE